MKIKKNEFGTTVLIADEGKAIRRKGEATMSKTTRVSLASNDSPDNWEDCAYGEPSDTRYYAVDLLASIGDVVGAERYDGIKAALSANRIGGVPVWDMLICGMFIPATDPRLAMIRTALVEAELVSNEEFDKILALAASDEHVSESGSEE